MENENVNVAAVTDTKTEVDGIYPQIIVSGTAEKPFFEIVYLDLKDGYIHVGFGSYDLAYVFQWLKEYFGETRAKIIDPESLRPKGRWEQVKSWATKAKYRCSICGREIMSATKVNIEKYPYCHCGAKMVG